ncbi:MAG: hypothetical protein SH808_03215 [Saprospiraceae bacterium]|nr:hypothetical protein [Saprospiraceae bacterium]
MKYLISITLILILESAHAQSHVQSTGIPEVFLIGEYEDRYLELSEQHPEMFMTVYNNDLDQAFKGWSEFLMDIEDYATDLKFDIKGTKLWMNIYFNPDGTISNLAFFPKPNSRNIPEDQLVTFFKNFVRQYRFLETSDKGFQHSASASFPTFFHRTTPETARSN